MIVLFLVYSEGSIKGLVLSQLYVEKSIQIICFCVETVLQVVLPVVPALRVVVPVVHELTALQVVHELRVVPSAS